MSGLINSAMSGLSAAQVALSVTSNNLSNVYTSGYNRQTVSFAQNGGTNTSAGYIGNGVNVSGINREYNAFIVSQLRQGQSTYNATVSYYQQVSRIDDLLADSTTSISANMEDFFSNLQNFVSNAADASARQTVLAKAEGLVNQFRTTDEYLRNLESDINQTVSGSVDQINNYSKQIASLNDKITRLTGANGGNPPNDLLDLRDDMINKLNQIVGVEVTQQGDGAINVSFAGGLSLVQGSTSYSVLAVPSSVDPSRTTIAYNGGAGAVSELPEGRITSGSLSGAFKFRSGVLTESRNQLGQIALSMSDAFNRVQAEGVDLYGNQGEPLFTIGSPRSIANANNPSDAAVSAVYSDVSQTKATDYRMDFDGTNWQVTRLSDNSKFSVAPDAQGKLNFDGLTVEVGNGPAQANDSFTLKTTSNAISGFGVAISDGGKLAAGLDDGSNQTGESDNRNAQKMLDLQKKQLVGGKATFSSAYASLVGTVGNQTAGAKVDAIAQGNVVNQLTVEQQSVSGVNLDEEYGNLIRFQQYYQANAQVIQVASTLFDSLLAIR
ncbi:flagellar hook-associated protein FlgK [Enterobacillus tribolii]|uniref:Flagellar hook-associated protein 1 n=1 Tax=Enterobacillus tribolii TaxID=1487935 RepID=A0A370R2W4_9GAMM|nr:flagellar hook-associated protein FlgK [Enterobacillus tribolii]MBW7984778.1 flagellar hook-associated protein FlgK [Enterobacillus tribolii]RDK96779.1 flagellar hook-associated protein 1 FlgK [Enterobacillus tribolii]